MAARDVLIVAACRSAVAPVGGAFAALSAHELGAPVLRALLAQAGVDAAAIDQVLIGNALGAGGNPARLLALAAGLPDRVGALSLDSQCNAGLDAITLGASLIASGQAEVVITGGVEAWSRAPMRAHRPIRPDAAPQPYERPAFAPDPERDPDLLAAATAWAREARINRVRQDAWAAESHRRALACRADLADEIVPVAGLAHDACPRATNAARAGRMPPAWRSATGLGTAATTTPDTDLEHAPGLLGVAPRADGAALVLLASDTACARLGLTPQARWRAGVMTGGAPECPMRSAAPAARAALAQAGIADIGHVDVIELHDAFAVQAIATAQTLGLDPLALNRHGGGLARGHPIGASGAIALVRVLADLRRDGRVGSTGLAVIAAAGGLGAAALVERV
ncbi:thiolase family protein [Sphaerotilus mobilis]|uniref:Acetyl-CoA C-acetyltransferase n=1 Tax=Sphaerotilus mobilis TaxID=47994 RepID=A0A4Q7LE71_9BURK|nr:thiolase family protein [Sphaerotilus mobilis]RZS52243.1 acetyl-CoA C-acetyltransferase [Sphaerotilus mobilis]